MFSLLVDRIRTMTREAVLIPAIFAACAVEPGPPQAVLPPETLAITVSATETVSPQTPTAAPAPTETAAPLADITIEPWVTVQPYDPDRIYFSQPGDTWLVLANRIGLLPSDLSCLDPCPIDPSLEPNRLLPASTGILLPVFSQPKTGQSRLIPDSELVFSASASNFNVNAYVQATNGFMSRHRQYLMMNAWNTGADVIALVARENSVNPRLLLALLEHQCGCILGESEHPEPFMRAGFYIRHDLYGQLVWAVYELSAGYYGWRAGTLTHVTLIDGTEIQLSPDLNAGTVALYNFFSKLLNTDEFRQALDPAAGFPATFRAMFGNPWTREVEIYSGEVSQPELDLPFETGHTWSYTGGPHPAFEGNGPFAALDFAPASAEPGCQLTDAWVTAVAEGVVVRSEHGLVMQDLDGDGDENTGWVIMYLHIGVNERVREGMRLSRGQRIGRPSCEGGTANGTHVHIARKLNGEWIAAGSGPLPFNLDGWVAVDGLIAYKGTLNRNQEVLDACTCSWRQSWIVNEEVID